MKNLSDPAVLMHIALQGPNLTMQDSEPEHPTDRDLIMCTGRVCCNNDNNNNGKPGAGTLSKP